ncbi:SGNH/GDSL hydrolase family protein [Arenibacter certesii]|uniref:Hydrolase n=1 Tax=Arenibacter certesii TaxID=228955 RepID=A0A918ISR2_9FLAO|nr:SGNH/GDSL hydrolase family protein [Arenibacter certesii]GGW30290.1 hydrolase [Arenibacter certesii]
MLRIFFSALLFSCLGTIAQAQNATAVKFVDALKFPLLGSTKIADTEHYYRIRKDLAANFPKRVKALSTNTAGFNVPFKTNSSSIKLRWTLREYNSLWNMTPLAVAGFDLYGWNGEEWQFVAAAKPTGLSNSTTVIENLDGKMQRFRLYFPLYSGVTEVEIGVDSGSDIQPLEDFYLPSKQIVVYGSSITQGASASRPGMIFTSILGRRLNMNFSNLGFSGAGKMEREVANVLKNSHPDLFILDCVPNPSIEEIRTRTLPFIETLRKENPSVPILMVESVFREHGHWNEKIGAKVIGQNNAFKEAYSQLKERGMEQIYYLDNTALIGTDHEATIDGTHFTDLGHKRIADKLFPVIKNILNGSL